MPTPRCSAEFQEKSCQGPVLIGSLDFTNAGLTKDGKRMFSPVPVMRFPTPCPGARPSHPPVVVDGFGRQFGGNWSTVEAAARINRANKNQMDVSEIASAGFFDDEWS